jgi:prepilin-type N-terminal cleavage/methylation domain-containing protein
MINLMLKQLLKKRLKYPSQHRQSIYSQPGYSLVELLIVIIVMGIALMAAASFFRNFVQTQLNLRLTKKADLQVTETALITNDNIAITAGSGLGYFNGFDYGAARRLGGELGIVTPLTINNRDAVAILTSSPNSPRLEVLAATTATGNIGTARLAPNLEPSSRLPQPGDLYLIVGGPAPTTQSTVTDLSKIVADTRLVKILNVKQITEIYGREQDNNLEITYDLCNGSCSQQLPGLTNNATPIDLPIISTQTNSGTRLTFELGSTLVPLRMLTLYYRNGELIENDGGVVVREGANVRILGGKDFVRAQVKDFSLKYELANGQTVPATTTTNLDQIIAIQILSSQQADTIQRNGPKVDRRLVRRLEIRPRLLEFFQ